MAHKVKSACPLNCWDSCGFHVTVEDGKVIKVDGDKGHPITKGKICGRGRMLESRTNSPERLLYPLKKIDGEFKQVSWEQALQDISLKMKELKDTFGTASVLHSHDYANGGLLTNLDQRFFNCYGGVTELTGSICWGAGIEAQSWDFGDAYSHGPDDILNSKHIVIWGRNVARTNMHLFQMLQEAKRNGTKLYVIDPIYNATAKIADRYFSVKPGMDGLLAAGIMKEMLRLGLEDRSFIENHSVGFEDLDELLNNVTLEEIAEKTEVPSEVMTELAAVYGDRPVSTFFGLGMQRYENGGNTIRLMDALIAVSGNIGIPGGGANYANRQVGQSFDTASLALPHRKTSSRQFTMMRQAEGILTAKDPEVKMIFVTCGNPLTQVPDSSRVREAFASVDTVVVMEQFMTDTAKVADYVLPVATVFEQEDLYYSSMYHHYVNYGPKLVDPPGEAKPDLWVWTELANRLGFGADFDFTREEFISMGLQSLKGHGITLEGIRESYHKELPVDKVPWADRQFKTPSGKYEFTSSAAFRKGSESKLTLALPRETKWTDKELAEKYPYTLLTIHPLRSNHSQHYHLLKPEPKAKVEVAENISAKLGLQENDYVKVWNDRGEMNGFVHIMKKAHPDTINIDEGIWTKFGGPVNNLTSSRESDNGLGSTLYDCLVNIKKI
ncbi:molybdopterin-dependent oxidoreductase [Bacillus sp. ISL-47]|uniref:molybdopterin-dependent oxidoreductase n=1 Tax=Bacillus sp. ISL-47 TaxID=2819130 RepID=UPI001BE8D4EC|nr:molybdopterin-dependent oxidoreductase [Bacillus sp. ISL-47]MBT2687253.1 molybdopterin-dependent oxidoreductase [Bacillus sp. ISL-47]MBT2706677.1 molybdopterin-dependent oxidoreductase [Pseudomonas sp. ISL-84]